MYKKLLMKWFEPYITKNVLTNIDSYGLEKFNGSL